MNNDNSNDHDGNNLRLAADGAKDMDPKSVNVSMVSFFVEESRVGRIL